MRGIQATKCVIKDAEIQFELKSRIINQKYWFFVRLKAEIPYFSKKKKKKKWGLKWGLFLFR